MKKKDAIDQLVTAMMLICTQNNGDFVFPGTIEIGIQAMIDLKGADWVSAELMKWKVSKATKRDIEKFSETFSKGGRARLEITFGDDGKVEDAGVDIDGYEITEEELRAEAFYEQVRHLYEQE